ncbi:MAG: hypothetical protein HYX75_06070 [Acidobacteria bacterium]|nr:hypothetical protein [Acidobacteriota bacterium]
MSMRIGRDTAGRYLTGQKRLAGGGWVVMCLLLLGAFHASAAEEDRWRKIGKGGLADAIAVDPRDSTRVYAAHWEDDVFRRSDDGGVTWQATGTIPYTEAIGYNLTIDPSDSEVLYIETDPEYCSSCDAALLRSTDAGVTWEILQYEDGVDGPIAIHPRNGSILYRADNYSGRVYRSVDGGVTWSVLAGLPREGLSITIDKSAQPIVLVGTASGIYRSTDGGASWIAANTGLPGDGSSTMATMLSASGTEAGIVYAATDRGLYRTIDGGAQWTRVSASFDTQTVTHISVDSRDSDVVWASSSGGKVYVTYDGGRAWRAHSIEGAAFTGLLDPTLSDVPYLITDIAAGSGDRGTAYALVRELGIFRTTDGGESWDLLGARLRGPAAQLVLPDPVMPGKLYAASSADPQYSFSDRELLTATSDGGSTWRLACDGLPAGDVVSGLGWIRDLKISTLERGMLFATTRRGVYRSVNGGRSWSPANKGIVRSANAGPLAIDPDDPAHVFVFVRKEGFFETLDAGLSWQRLSTDLASRLIATIVPDTNRPGVLYAGAHGEWYGDAAAVFRSLDGGRTWSVLGKPFGDDGVDFIQIAVAPTSPSTVYALGGFGLYRLRSGDGDWSNLGLIDGRSDASCVAVDPADPAVLYAGTTRAGVFRSVNSGDTWTPFSTGLNDRSGSDQVRHIAFGAEASGALYAATGNGVYARALNR